MIYITLFVSLAMANYQSQLQGLINTQSKIFTQINDKTHYLMDQIFESIHLDPKFSEKPQIKMLLTMHNDLNDVIKQNYDMFERILNNSRVDDNIVKANETKQLKIMKSLFNPKRRNRKVKNKRVKKKYDIKIPQFRNAIELFQFVEVFINKLKRKVKKQPIFQKTSMSILEDNATAKINVDYWEPNKSIGIQTRRIYKGVKTYYKRFPFIASIHVMEKFVCAGSIIKSDLVITAAACLQLAYNNRFFRENPKSIRVRIGSDYPTRLGELLQVIEVYFHPLYEPKTLKNNLVILRMREHLNLIQKTRKKVKRILLDDNSGNMPINTGRIIILGWGSSHPDLSTRPFPKVKFAALDLYQINECKDIYSRNYVTESNFCAGFVGPGPGACNKDLGGPGIVGNKLMGVISFGPTVCGQTDTPTVFTRVGSYAKWIQSIMKMTAPVAFKRTTLWEPMKVTAYEYYMKKSNKIYPGRKTYPGGKVSRRNLSKQKYSDENENDNLSSQSESDDSNNLPSYRPVTNENLEFNSSETTSDEVYNKQVPISSSENVLKDILAENNSIINDILYDDLFDDFVHYFRSSKEKLVHNLYIPFTTKTKSPSTIPKTQRSYTIVPYITTMNQKLYPPRDHPANIISKNHLTDSEVTENATFNIRSVINSKKSEPKEIIEIEDSSESESGSSYYYSEEKEENIAIMESDLEHIKQFSKLNNNSNIEISMNDSKQDFSNVIEDSSSNKKSLESMDGESEMSSYDIEDDSSETESSDTNELFLNIEDFLNKSANEPTHIDNNLRIRKERSSTTKHIHTKAKKINISKASSKITSKMTTTESYDAEIDWNSEINVTSLNDEHEINRRKLNDKNETALELVSASAFTSPNMTNTTGVLKRMDTPADNYTTKITVI